MRREILGVLSIIGSLKLKKYNVHVGYDNLEGNLPAIRNLLKSIHELFLRDVAVHCDKNRTSGTGEDENRQAQRSGTIGEKYEART